MNTLEYAKIFQTALDNQVIAEATSGWMEANAGQVQYTGGNEVKVPMITTDGLADYDRETGYVDGAVNLSYQTLKLTQDRGRAFTLDAMDVNETNFIANATNVMASFQREKVIPEIDAYRYSKIASAAITKERASGGYTVAEGTILSTLLADIAKVQDVVGDIPLIITMATPVAAILSQNSTISKMLDVTDFSQGDVTTKVRSIDGYPIIRVPSARMLTAYTFYDGTTTGQTKGGFAAATDAKHINWIICPRSVPMGISKTDTMRIFDPQTYQKANAWRIDYRKFHDLFMMNNKWNTVWVNIQEALQTTEAKPGGET